MEGITVLQTHTHREITLLALILIVVILSASCIAEAAFEIIFATVVILITVVFAIFGVSESIGKYNTYRTKYTVSVDDSVGFNDFLGKYRIVTYENGCYVVEEIEG